MFFPTADSPGTLQNTRTPLSSNSATLTTMNELNLSIPNKDITSTVGFTAVIASVLVGLIVLLLVLVLVVGGLAMGIFMPHMRKRGREVILECTSCEPSKPDLSTNNGVLLMNYSEKTLSENQNSCSKFAEPKEGSGVENSCYHDISLKEYETYPVIDTSRKNIEMKKKDGTDNFARKSKSPIIVEESTQELEAREVTLLYSHVQKEPLPPIPRKTPELYKELELEADIKNITNHSASIGSNSREKSPFCYCSNAKATCYNSAENIDNGSNLLGIYSVVEGEVSPEEMYCEVTEKPPSVTITHALIKSLNSSTPRNNGVIHHTDNNKTSDLDSQPVPKDFYTDPDNVINTNPEADDGSENVYDIIHESLELSMFIKCEGTKELDDEDMYAPVYDVSTLNCSIPQDTLSLQPDNIKKVKTIGTGYFGKVYLADTVNLSHKDLRLGDSEDKSKAIRVAVKQLKSDPSSQAIEAFEKELKFMSTLDHENVIRVLGSCKGATTFVMMEYMENGDLNQYLVNFDNIVQETEDTGDMSIRAYTLTKMAAEIANGMKYLSSKNFIHRDLATRNCLVGKDMRVKIADFGMSRNLYQSHYYVLKGHAILPVRWMAKECFYGKFSTKTDVWAFGVTMWEIFTLAKDIPYEDMRDEELLEDATSDNNGRTLLAKPANCLGSVYDVMLMCWKEQAKDRPGFDILHLTLLGLLSQDATTE